MADERRARVPLQLHGILSFVAADAPSSWRDACTVHTFATADAFAPRNVDQGQRCTPTGAPDRYGTMCMARP